MESNNSSSNTATACSSDPPPPNQRNDDKGKQTCSNEGEANDNPDSSPLKTYKRRSSQSNGGTSNESEVNENNNNNPESSVLKAGKKRKSSSDYDGFVHVEDDGDLKFLPDWLFEEETPWNNDQCYSKPLRMEHSVSGNYDSLEDFKGFDPTEDVLKYFANDEEGPPQPSGGSPSQQLYHDYHPTEAENQTVANSEGLFDYIYVEPQMEHLVSGNVSLNDSKDPDSKEDVKDPDSKEDVKDPDSKEDVEDIVDKYFDMDRYLADHPELHDDYHPF